MRTPIDELLEASLPAPRLPKRVARSTIRVGWTWQHFVEQSGRRPHQLRRSVQSVFLGICLLIGCQFACFCHSCAGEQAGAVQRPPGVESFLPISALMSAKLWVLTGLIHPVHPAGFLIFVAVLAVSFLFKRSFCSWVCPVGFVSEKLSGLGFRLFRRNVRLPRWLDIPLRGVKYLVLALFAYVIIWRMDGASLKSFLDSPFNQMADVRLMEFFQHPSGLTLAVLGILIMASLVIRQFWCRYLCPYGALTALVGLLSPTRIKRDAASCIGCAKCFKACPASLPVHRLGSVRSDECTFCLECVNVCPVRDTLGVSPVFSRRRIRPLLLAAAIGGTFLAMVVYGRLSGHWESSVTALEIKQQLEPLAPGHSER